MPLLRAHARNRPFRDKKPQGLSTPMAVQTKRGSTSATPRGPCSIDLLGNSELRGKLFTKISLPKWAPGLPAAPAHAEH
jgi:hypothetical protein